MFAEVLERVVEVWEIMSRVECGGVGGAEIAGARYSADDIILRATPTRHLIGVRNVLLVNCSFEKPLWDFGS